MLLALDSVLPPKGAIYAAGPLETGREYFILRSQGKDPSQDYRARNQHRLTAFVKQLRQTEHPLVIDPGLLRCPNWSGSDYGTFFLNVLARYAFAAWFLDGWHFSFGATKEFVFCQERKILCCDKHGNPIDRSQGIAFLSQSVGFLEELGQETSRMRRRLSALQDLA